MLAHPSWCDQASFDPRCWCEGGLDRRAKVELFERLRREYEFGIGTVKGVARTFGVHRRMVRQAVTSPSIGIPAASYARIPPTQASA